MKTLEAFLAYAADFERTLGDDDWSRLERHFAPDAVYEVTGATPYACRLEGREAIFAGLRKSLDGFDRKFPGRDIELREPPEVDGDVVRLAWAVTYLREGSPSMRLEGRSIATLEGGVIRRLEDVYDDGPASDATSAWLAEHGAGLDGSYV